MLPAGCCDPDAGTALQVHVRRGVDLPLRPRKPKEEEEPEDEKEKQKFQAEAKEQQGEGQEAAGGQHG